jgi:Asp-tRNA(Asn)/Glu-tRNA(Gln) amidotransferase A subunit family amidase
MPEKPLSTSELALLEQRARRTRRRFAARVSASRIDVIICPPSPTPAPAHGGMSQLEHPGSYAELYNLLGWPSGVVTTGLVKVPPVSSSGRSARQVDGDHVELPVGVQVVARPFREDRVLRVMEQLETAMLGEQRSPPEPRL